MSKLLYQLRLQFRILMRRFKAFFFKAPPVTDIRHIVIGATTLLGDLVMTAPLIRATQWQYPQAKIFVLVRPGCKELAECIPEVHQAIVVQFNDPAWLNIFIQQAQHWDLAIVPFETKLIPLFYGAGIKTIRSFPDPKGRHNDQIHQKIAIPDKVQHLSLLMLQLLAPIDILPELKTPHLIPKAADLLPLLKNTEYIVIHPGAGGETRRWPLEHYAHIADHFAALNYNIVLSGAQNEQELTTGIAKAMKLKNVLDLSGKTSLPELAALLKNAVLVIGPDTGALHLARALDTYSLTLLGSSQAELFAPHPKLHDLNKSKFLYIPDLPCRDKKTVFHYAIPGVRKCDRKRCLLIEHPCMRQISVESVLTVLKEFSHLRRKEAS